MSISLGNVKPSDCVLAFGIPTCKKEFWDAKEDELGRDFVKNQVWQAYDFQVLSPLRRIEPKLKRLGVKIVHKLTLHDFGKLFIDSSNKVVILFSHWKDDTVEFFDGMASIEEIVKVIPSSYEGVVDLCVCHPEGLAKKLRNHLPVTSLIRYLEGDVEATPYNWLYFYWTVFTILDDSSNSDSNNSGCSYLEALEKAVKAFAKR